jgi:hypothetical protein
MRIISRYYCLDYICQVFARLRTLLSSPPGHGKGPRDPIGGFIPLADVIKRINHAQLQRTAYANSQ